jgi:tRNA dimethylallyltransferase
VIQGYRLIQVPINQPLRDELQDKPMEELTELLKSYKTVHNVSDSDTTKRIIRAIEIEEYSVNHPETDTYYPKIKPLLIGVRYDRFTERRRITERLKQRLGSGMIEEVKNILQEGITPDQLIYYGLEYKFITEYITGVLSYDQMFTLLNTAIHQFAKRQMTWFRRMERQGMKIWWLDGYETTEEKTNRILEMLQIK